VKTNDTDRVLKRQYSATRPLGQNVHVRVLGDCESNVSYSMSLVVVSDPPTYTSSSDHTDLMRPTSSVKELHLVKDRQEAQLWIGYSRPYRLSRYL